jgi:hypothetical protein
MGLFANQAIPANTSLGYLVPLSSNLYPYYLKHYCEHAVNNMQTSNRPHGRELRRSKWDFIERQVVLSFAW